MKSLHRIAQRGLKRGQALIIVIAAIPAILGSLTLVIDVGNAYFNKLEIQTASDSAVLSGGLYLPSYPDQAIAIARQFANSNGLSNSEITSIQVTPDNKEVILSATRALPCYLCAVLGESEAHAQPPVAAGLLEDYMLRRPPASYLFARRPVWFQSRSIIGPRSTMDSR
jgi:Putative Flp pilus-assembly TadE/G-like